VERITELVEKPGYDLKPIQERIDGVTLSENILKLTDFIADEFVATSGAAIAAAMPPGIRTRLTTYYEGTGMGETPAQVSILSALARRGKLSEKALRSTQGFTEVALKALIATGAVTKNVALPAERRANAAGYVLDDSRNAREFIRTLGAKKPAQAQCLAVLLDSPSTPMTPAEIAVLARVSDATVKALILDGLLKTAESESIPSANETKVKLNADQLRAAASIELALKAGEFSHKLLFGITGSGKTEVYLRSIGQSLAIGKQALYLVPEIALTAQVVGQLKSRFGRSVAVMHSGLPTGERLRNWRRAASGDAPVVVGARSAIFAPLTNLGLIVLDEEHDGSYKQDNAPRYDVRALARERAQNERCVLVAGSATPSVETFYKVMQAEIEVLRLPKRAAAMALPEVHVEDLRETYKSKKPSMLSERLRKELAQTIQAGEQALLFINRRAFSRSLLCRDCGYTPQCPRCSVALTYHARPLHLRCHHCNHKARVFDRCPACGSLRIRPLGIGTQRVEEFVRREFPGMKVERLDRDIASRRGAVEEIFARVRNGDTQALIGTQMIAKGLDFENVTLVGVIAADIGLSIPDYRSTERTFQLITQVAGRAGRKRPGRVIVQSFAPDHPSIKLGAAQDYEAFYAEEISEREDARYPPFVRLVNVIVSGPDRTAVHESATKARELLENRLDAATIYGPAECALARLHGNWRSHVLVKLPLTFRMTEFPRMREFDIPSNVNLAIDVDPGNLM
jgi:primosomal protein N' (replication factor Y)